MNAKKLLKELGGELNLSRGVEPESIDVAVFFEKAVIKSMVGGSIKKQCDDILKQLATAGILKLNEVYDAYDVDKILINK